MGQITDTFTSASGATLISHTSDTGNTWAESAGTPGCITLNGGGAISVATNVEVDVSNWTPAAADYDVSCSLYINVASANISMTLGIGGRAGAAAFTGYFILLLGSNSNSSLVLYQGGNATPLATYNVSVAQGQTYELKLSMRGNTITVYWDGTAVITYTASGATIVSAVGQAAIYMQPATGVDGVHLSDFVASDAPADATSYTLSGPSGGQVNAASTNFTVTPNGPYTGTITPASTGTGTFSPTSLTWSETSAPQTFTYTPTSTAGSPHTISTTSSPGLSNPSGIAYTVNPAILTAGTAWVVSTTLSSATISWTAATGGTSPITAQLQQSAHGANSWSNVSGATLSPATATGLSASASYDYRVAYTNTVSTTVYSSTVTATTGTTATYAVQAADLWDNGYTLASNPPQSYASRFIFTTNAASVTINGTTTLYSGYPAWSELGIRINGVTQSTPLSFTVNGSQSFTVSGLSGTSTIEIIAGCQSDEGGSTVYGSFVNSITYPQSASFSVSAPTVGTRVLIYGDSIASGADATYPETQGFIPVLRYGYNFRTMAEAWGYRSLYDDANTGALLSAFVSRIAGYTPSVVWLAIGTNDYGLNKWSAAGFGTAYASLLDALHAALPSVIIVAQSPIVRSSEVANTFGNTLGDYRTQIATACGARWWARFVDGTQILATTDLNADGVHPTTAGQGKYADKMALVLTVIAGLVGGGGIPAAGDVRLGVASGNATGTLAVPSPNKVIAGAATDNTAGTYVEVLTPNVLSGIQFGAAGTQYTGVLICPTVQQIAGAILADPTQPIATTPQGWIIAARTDGTPLYYTIGTIYCQRSDVEDIFGVANVARWADLDNDQDATKIANRISRAIVWATAEMEDRLRNGPYQVPLTGTSATVVDLCAKLAGVWLVREPRHARLQCRDGPAVPPTPVRAAVRRDRAGRDPRWQTAVGRKRSGGRLRRRVPAGRPRAGAASRVRGPAGAVGTQRARRVRVRSKTFEELGGTHRAWCSWFFVLGSWQSTTNQEPRTNN